MSETKYRFVPGSAVVTAHKFEDTPDGRRAAAAFVGPGAYAGVIRDRDGIYISGKGGVIHSVLNGEYITKSKRGVASIPAQVFENLYEAVPGKGAAHKSK